MRLQKLFLGCSFIFCRIVGSAQTIPIYKDLPVGKYAVGFKIVTIIDDSRIERPAYNYLGEKNEGDRRKKISIHLWYPAKVDAAKRVVTFGDYCYNYKLTSTSEPIDQKQIGARLLSIRNSIERWFGKTTDSAWQTLIATQLLAEMDAEPIPEKFPLLIGMLRPLSTSVVNELLASNGYVVAMIPNEGFSTMAESALNDIPDMQFAIAYLSKNGNVNDDIGTFGFSGSGFSQVLFAMYDQRVKAVAD